MKTLVRLGTWGGLFVSFACSSSSTPGGESTATMRAAVVSPGALATDDCSVGRACALEILLPDGLAPGGTWAAARQKVSIGDRLHLSGGTVASVGTQGVVLGTDVVAQSVISEGRVELRDRAQITDKLVSPITPQMGNQTSIPAGFVPSSAKPFGSYLVGFTFPPVSAATVTADAGKSVTVVPGVYNDLVVRNSGTVILQPGEYTFRNVQVEPDAHIKLPSPHVRLNVAAAMTLRGSVEALSGSYDWSVIYASKEPLYIEKGFRGTLLAPRATLTLRGSPATYSATSVYGNELVIEAGAQLTFVPSNVPVVSRAECTKLLTSTQPSPPDGAVSTQFMFDVLRLCQAPGIPDCYGRFKAAVNTDRYTSALRYLAKSRDIDDHIALAQDHDRKSMQMRKDPARLASYCQGDADGDLVPDSFDKCPGTPPLTPTNDDGCTSTAPKPKGANRGAVDSILAQMGVLHDPACDNTPPPPMPGKVGSSDQHPYFYGSSTGLDCATMGSGDMPSSFAFFATKDPTLAWGPCRVWYEIKATVISPSGQTMGMHYTVPIQAASKAEGFDGSGNPLAAFYFYLNRAGALPQEKVLATLLVENAVLFVQARAVDGNGRQSDWTTPQVSKVRPCPTL